MSEARSGVRGGVPRPPSEVASYARWVQTFESLGCDAPELRSVVSARSVSPAREVSARVTVGRVRDAGSDGSGSAARSPQTGTESEVESERGAQVDAEAVSVLCHADVLARYSEAHRAYHTVQHLAECFEHFDGVRARADRPGEVELALWLHDVIYDTRTADSEARSAQIARVLVDRAGGGADVGERVAELILATRHSAAPEAPDAQLLVDIDLAILGADTARFAEYEEQVRREYAFVPSEAFVAARVRVLSGFLARPSIYATDHFRALLEGRARDNLARSIRALGG